MEIIQPERKYRWYFAYHTVFGKVWPLMWAEDDGICVGGRPTNILCNKIWEITEDEFNDDLRKLELKHHIPFVEDVDYQMKYNST